MPDVDTNVDSTPATVVPVVATVTDAATAAPATDATATDAGKPAAPEPEKRTPWFQARIDAVTREKWEEKRRADAAEARIKELETARITPTAAPAVQQPNTGAPAAFTMPSAPMPQTDIDRLVNERASALASQSQFNARCDKIYQEGIKDVPNFKAALDNFGMFGGLAQHPSFLSAVTQLPEGNGAHVLAHLGSNLDEANRILTISDPIQQALEVSKISANLKKGPGISQAPAPVKPTTGGNASAVAGPDTDGKFKSHAEYTAWKEKNFKR